MFATIPVQWFVVTGPEAEMPCASQKTLDRILSSGHITVPKGAAADRDGLPEARNREPMDPSDW